MITCYFNNRIKTKHIAEIYGFYVEPDRRGEGIGARLFERALAASRRKKGIIKVSLAVNPERRVAIRIYRKAGLSSREEQRRS